MILRFEWNKVKAEENLKKHNVSFDEASTVFQDTLACIFYDGVHSVGEMREIIIGHSIIGRLLIISFTEKAKNIVRIISARQVTRREKREYEENRNI
ncbi:MAG: BrnT family toxin [Nitrospinae bacterium]|nr:BrnT family toxin [Nitrospinota bacterium]MBI3815798.1 BrnT family toxin [Nitrospinota bacterium]